MRAFRHWEIDGQVLIAIEDAKLATAFRAFAYAWDETGHTADQTQRLTDILWNLFDTCDSEKAGSPPPAIGVSPSLH